MNIPGLRTYLLDRPGATEDRPFGPQPLVMKVGGKMFALLAEHDQPPRLSLKCDPAHAQFLRDEYPSVQPGYHLNKTHWNTVVLDSSVPEEELRSMIDESYRLVVQSLTQVQRRALQNEASQGTQKAGQ